MAALQAIIGERNKVRGSEDGSVGILNLHQRTVGLERLGRSNRLGRSDRTLEAGEVARAMGRRLASLPSAAAGVGIGRDVSRAGVFQRRKHLSLRLVRRRAFNLRWRSLHRGLIGFRLRFRTLSRGRLLLSRRVGRKLQAAQWPGLRRSAGDCGLMPLLAGDCEMTGDCVMIGDCVTMGMAEEITVPSGITGIQLEVVCGIL